MPNKKLKTIYFDGLFFYNYVCETYGSLLKFCKLSGIKYGTLQPYIYKEKITFDLLFDICEFTGLKPLNFTRLNDDSFWICPLCKQIERVKND